MTWETLKAAVTAVITANGNNEITGDILRNLLNSNIIEQLGANLYRGIALPTTVPTASPESEHFYFAFKQGTYSNFSAISLKNELAILKWNGSSWTKETVLLIKPELDRTALEYSLYFTDENIANGNVFSGRVNHADGVAVSDGAWLSTDFIYIAFNPTVTRVASALSSGSSSVAGVSFFDSDLNYLGFIDTIPQAFTFKPKTYFENAHYMRVSGAASLGISLKLKSDIRSSLTALENKIALVVGSFDFATTAENGFLDSNGVFVSAANWRATDFIDSSNIKNFTYRGVAEGNARAIVGYDANMNFLEIIAGLLDSSAAGLEFVLPDSVKFVRASARMISGDVFEFISASSVQNDLERDFFIPETVYAKQAETLKINPNGLVAKHPDDNSVDIFSNLQLSNEKFLQLTPGASDSTINVKIRKVSGQIENAGDILVKVTPTADIISPNTAQNFICLGDSLTEGVSASGIQGAYVNELARRLTGIGTELLTGTESPAALALSNIYFRGTRGDQAILHEGRGGWAASTYLGVASSGGVTNAFWNPTASEFDLDYYLDQNNFKSTQTVGGVNPTGSNLTVIILLGWNNAYNGGPTAASTGLKLLIDKIKTDMPDVKVKILGLNTPPRMNYKTFTGNRNVTPESIMRDVILPFNREYKALADNVAYSSYVEFVPISQGFFSENSYPSTTRSASFRDSTALQVYSDYVHPNSRGYAQIADCLFYNILYNYCKS